MKLKSQALEIEAVSINEHCVGLRWAELDRDHLARLIALVAMGQAAKAALVIKAFGPAQPEATITELCDEAINTLTAQSDPPGAPRGYPRVQRDGFIFECISWVAAMQSMGNDAVLKPPHVSSTTQGVDGLMLEIDRAASCIRNATIFEDKCTNDPRSVFLNSVLPALKDRHSNRRSAELVSLASTLLAVAGLAPAAASSESVRILDPAIRKYRAAFAVSSIFDTEERRSFLFGRYEEIDGLNADQRIGACFVIDDPLRGWFDGIADLAVTYIESIRQEDV